MKFPQRKSIRLKGYDYSQAGLYFITICVQDRECLFGDITNGDMVLNAAGRMVENEWLKIAQRFTNTRLHEYVVMPNHFHAILEIAVGATLVVARNENMVNRNNYNGIGQPPLSNNGQPQGIAPTIAPTIASPDSPTDNATDSTNNANMQPYQSANGQQPDRQPHSPDNGQPHSHDNGQPHSHDNGQPHSHDNGQPQGIAPTDTAKKPKTVGDMVGAFQSIVTVEYIRGVKQWGWPSFNGKLWQRNYWEHIIRDESSYQRISDYIINNPKNWDSDKFHGQ